MDDDTVQVAANKGRKHLTVEVKHQIVALHQCGLSGRAIAKQVNMSATSIHNFIRRFDTTHSYEITPGRGRKRKTSPTDDHYIVEKVKRDRFITSSQILAGSALPDISTRTVRRRITESGEFNSYWAARKPFISEMNRQKRLEWCQARKDWSLDEWRTVMWTDESPFVLRYHGSRRVWRLHNERFSCRCTVASVKHDTKINVWGAFCAKGVGMLHHIKGIMDQHIYLDILENVMVPSADMLFGGHTILENWIFQQDNDPKHTANSVKDWLGVEGIPVLPWPAQSPDLNPIENLWSILDRQCSKRTCNSAAELFQTLQACWNQISVDTLDQLVCSMPARCAAIIAANGFFTKY